MHPTEFILNSKDFINDRKKYLIIGDLNIDILQDKTISVEFLSSLFENDKHPEKIKMPLI